LSCVRRIPQADAAVRAGKWNPVYGTSLADKRLGLIGFGHIGKAVARRAAGFDVKVLAYDTYLDHQAAEQLKVTPADKDDLLSLSDIVSLHVPKLPDTLNMIGERELALMKPSAYLINASRGAVVDERALYQALSSGRLAGAGLDVFSVEPLPADHLLTSLPNCILTPHIGAHTYETIRQIGLITAQTILEGLGLSEMAKLGV
jgi:D-3-phosphoglycerate dehydrogenase / 2-oxoglutarate reductase